MGLEVFLGFLWTQKRVKTLGFLRFLNMQLFGSLKLLMALWAHLCPFWLKTAPKARSKLCFKNAFYHLSKSSFPILQKKHKKKKLDNISFFFGAFLGTILGPILGPDRPKLGQDEPKRAIRSSKSQKAAFSKTLKNLQ